MQICLLIFILSKTSIINIDRQYLIVISLKQHDQIRIRLYPRHDVNGFVHVMHYVNSIFHVMVPGGLAAAVEQVDLHGHDVKNGIHVMHNVNETVHVMT